MSSCLRFLVIWCVLVPVPFFQHHLFTIKGTHNQTTTFNFFLPFFDSIVSCYQVNQQHLLIEIDSTIFFHSWISLSFLPDSLKGSVWISVSRNFIDRALNKSRIENHVKYPVICTSSSGKYPCQCLIIFIYPPQFILSFDNSCSLD